jgi:hypothetical protein
MPATRRLVALARDFTSARWSDRVSQRHCFLSSDPFDEILNFDGHNAWE